jgi:DivIVA domain-containing protein
MTESSHTFRTVMRGYDPAAVDQHVGELSAALAAAQQHAASMTQRADALAAAAAEPVVQSAPTFADLGARVGQILSLADEEAAHIRTSAAAEAEKQSAALNAATIEARADADKYATQVRTSAEREAARVLEDAKRSADQLLDEADRQAATRRGEAEAIYEGQRAQAAKAAADFEQTLAGRRDKAEQEFQEHIALAERQLVTAQERAAQLRKDAEQVHADATRKAAALTAESERSAEQTVAEAIARADRIRAESDRELVAASQRRDSINAQLTNVRQMLATLSGTTPAAVDPAQPDEAPAEAPAEAPDAAEATDSQAEADPAPTQESDELEPVEADR